MDDQLEQAVQLHEQGKYEDSLKLLKKSAESHHPLALYLYALHLREGWGCQRDQKKGFQILQEAVKILSDKIDKEKILTTKELEENEVVLANISEMRKFSIGDQRRKSFSVRGEKAEIKGRPRARSMSRQATRVELIPMAIFELGICYFYGWGIPKATNIAAYYFDIAASLGDSQAQNFLGNMYERGLGVKKSKVLAAKYYRMDRETNEREKPWILKPKYDLKSNAIEEASLSEKLKNVPEPVQPTFSFMALFLIGYEDREARKVCLMRISISLLLTTILAKTLVLINEEQDLERYSRFFGSLQARGHSLVFKNDVVRLIEYEEKTFDHVLVLTPKALFHGALNMGELVDFVNLGGNVLLAGSEKNTDAMRDFAYEFSVDFTTTPAVDYFSNNNDTQVIKTSKIVGPDFVAQTRNPILYSGAGHSLSGKNPLIFPILVGEDSAFSGEKKVNEHSLLGSKLHLVSAFQALNNARVVFVGSTSLFNNEYFDQKVQLDGKSVKSGNEEFVTELSKWVFQEKSVVRINHHKHHRRGETNQHGIYRIKDDMIYTLDLVILQDKKWIPFQPQDVQFEAVMLDPQIRQTMKPKGKSLVASFRLPDRYGVYTFKVEYNRRGLSNVLASETVQVRPFRHDQYPRFITAANPYYANIFSMMVGFFALTVVFLFYKEPVKKVKTE